MNGGRSAEHLTKMSNVRTSPKWTFKGRRESPRPMETPGPGSYTGEQAGAPGTPNFKRNPSYGFGTSPREGMRGSLAPGPGQYSPAEEGARSGYPKYGFGTSQRQTKPAPHSPGPGSYSHRAPMGSDGPKHVLAARRDGLKAAEVPGPGSYHSDRLAMMESTVPKYGFGTSTRTGRQMPMTPGPGAYTSAESMSGPKYSMSTKRESGGPMATPGPGAYCGAHTTFGY